MDSNLVKRINILNSIRSVDPVVRSYLDHLDKHRLIVLKICDRLGIHELGLMHDADKYDQDRLIAYSNYWQDKENLTGDDLLKYRKHKNIHRLTNKHHPQYWYNKDSTMDLESFLEMIADWVASGLVNDEKYEPRNTLTYYRKNNPTLLDPLPGIKAAAEEWMLKYSLYGDKYLTRDNLESIYNKYNKGLLSDVEKVPGKIIL